MTKILVPLLTGFFLGALVTEILHRKNPELVKATEERAKRLSRSLRQAFSEGYASGGQQA